MDADDEFELMRRAMREFAMACRIERNRLAQARLEDIERQLDEETGDALLARRLAEHAIDRCR